MSGAAWPGTCTNFMASIQFARFRMSQSQSSVVDSELEVMILEQMDVDGRILVRSLDKIHARTGINYATISKVAENMLSRRQS